MNEALHTIGISLGLGTFMAFVLLFGTDSVPVARFALAWIKVVAALIAVIAVFVLMSATLTHP